ncbi:MAG: T9SS type A sorting domain-containing protein [Ignavibacteria bacterium]|nr:T9SS type A sorting domain-containing protein [Ignavibacteria bacterium]
MNKNLQTYFDTAKKARNVNPLLTSNEVMQQISGAQGIASPAQSMWKINTFVAGSIVAVASLIALFYYNNQTTSPQSHQMSLKESLPSQSPQNLTTVPQIISQSTVQKFSPKEFHGNTINISPIKTTRPSTFNTNFENQAQNLHSSNSQSNLTDHRIPNIIPTSNDKDIEGLKRIELTETEAVSLAIHYPKLHVWLQREFSSTDTCDITLSPTDKVKSANTIHHSAVLLRVSFEHSDAREFVLWFTPTKEFTGALPGRYREQLQNELLVLAEVKKHCIPAEQACKAIKNDSPFFDLCRRESGSLSDVSIAPNPARERAECTFTLKEQRDVNISLHDLNGRFVRTMIFNESKPSGENKVPLMLDGIPTGAYLVAIRTIQGEQAVQQLVVIP